MARREDSRAINRILCRALQAIDRPTYPVLVCIMAGEQQVARGANTRSRVIRRTTKAIDIHGKEQEMVLSRIVLPINGVNARYNVDLVQGNPRGAAAATVDKLSFVSFPFTPEAVKTILCPFLGSTKTLQTLQLDECKLGDKGISAIVNALLDNGNNNTSIIKHLGLENNYITSNGLPHLTRLLLQHDSLLEVLTLDSNPGLFDNQENSRIFSSAIAGHDKLRTLSLCLCQMPGQAITLLFEAVALNMTRTLTTLYVYDLDQLQRQDLEHVLKIIPKMGNLCHLHVNLDVALLLIHTNFFYFMNESVFLAFHHNTSIQHLYSGEHRVAIAEDGPIFAILQRNRHLYKAKKLLEHERSASGGVWGKGLERLGTSTVPATRGNTGATAIYKIVCEKLPSCWLYPPPIVTATSVFSDSNGERLHTRDEASNDDGDDVDAQLEQPQPKRSRSL